MVNITLPDGSVRSFDAPVTVAQVAQSIGSGLAKAALAGKVNGELVDTSYLMDADAQLAIITDKDADGVDVIRHNRAFARVCGQSAVSRCASDHRAGD